MKRANGIKDFHNRAMKRANGNVPQHSGTNQFRTTKTMHACCTMANQKSRLDANMQEDAKQQYARQH